MITLLKNKWQVQQEILDYCNRYHNTPYFYHEDETELHQIIRSAYTIDWSQAHKHLGLKTHQDSVGVRANSTAYIQHLSQNENDWSGCDDLYRYYCNESSRTQGNATDKHYRQIWDKVFPNFWKVMRDINWMEKFAHVMWASKPKRYRTPVTA